MQQRQLVKNCKVGATIIGFQNGVGNARTLRQNINDQTVLSATVGFNVVRFDDQHLRYHRGTEGDIVIEDHIIWSKTQ
ncbi:MAG: hypothetical protein GY761_11750 [Hyphomicrobiales bacterium]|nr:hypothetical protein [Hyphomicrobiales bacterium]